MSKTTPQQNGSFRFVSPDDAADRALRMREQMAVGCQRCGATFDGLAGDCIEWSKSHRLTHPGAVDRGQRVRQAAARVADASPRVSL